MRASPSHKTTCSTFGRIMQPICINFALKSELLRKIFANVHFLLYLCSGMWSLLTIFFLQFANKAGSDVVCLSPTAIEMRVERGIEIDSLDYAVSPLYLDSIQQLGAKVLHTSRWMNGATVEANNEAIRKIENCAFVDAVYRTRTDDTFLGISSLSLRKREEIVGEKLEAQGEEERQLSQLNLHPLHQAGYKGKGIRIGVVDGSKTV